MENTEDFLRELRNFPDTKWIADEIDETLFQGVSMNVKEAIEDNSFSRMLPLYGLPAQERNKRQKYETSRPFTEQEKVAVILKAFEVMYLDLPAIRASAIKNLMELSDNIESIIFSSSDDEVIQPEINHEIKFAEAVTELDEYKELHSRFIGELKG